jgi:chromatin remodeling complex protein RSC6
MPKQTVTNNKNLKKENNKVENNIEDEIEDDDIEDEIEEEIEEIEENEDNDNDNDKKKSKKVEYISDSYEDSILEADRVINEIEKLTKYLKCVNKTAKKQFQKRSKQSKKRRDNNSDVPKKATGFIKAKFVPDKFKDFYENHLKNDSTFSERFTDFNIEDNQPQTDITKMIYHYIRTNDLYNKNEDGTPNKRAIKPDQPLTDLLSIERGESIGFNNFQTYIKRLYNSNVVEETVSSDEVEVEEIKVKSSKNKKSTDIKANA